MQYKHTTIISLMLASAFALTATLTFAEPPVPAMAGNGGECQPHDDHGPGGWDHHGGPHGPGGMEHHWEHKLSQLGLSPEQHDQIRKILESQKPAQEEKMHALHDTFAALQKASTADSYNAKQVQEIANQQAKIQADLTVAHTSTIHQVYALLTPEQKQKWEAMKDDHDERHGPGDWHKRPDDMQNGNPPPAGKPGEQG